MKIMITSLTGGTGKTVLAYNLAKRFAKPLLVDLTENMHLSIIFNVKMFASGYHTFQAEYKNLDELVVRNDAISFLPRGAHDSIEPKHLKRLMEIEGYDAVIADVQLLCSQILEICPLFDIILIPMRCDISVMAENYLIAAVSKVLNEKSSSSVIVPVILKNRVNDAHSSFAVRMDEKKIKKSYPVCDNITNAYTVEHDPDVHNKTWENRMESRLVEGKYGTTIAAMMKRFVELTQEKEVKKQ